MTEHDDGKLVEHDDEEEFVEYTDEELAEYEAQGKALLAETKALSKEVSTALWIAYSFLIVCLIFICIYVFGLWNSFSSLKNNEIPELTIGETIADTPVEDWFLNNDAIVSASTVSDPFENVEHSDEMESSFVNRLFVTTSDISALEELDGFEYFDDRNFTVMRHPYSHRFDGSACDGSDVFEVKGHLDEGSWMVVVTIGKPFSEFMDE